MLKTKHAFFSEIGKARSINQDFVLINKAENIYIVADGMGGHAAGEVASSLACTTVEEYIVSHKKKTRNYLDLVSRAVKEANKVIFEKAFKEEESRGMGTTITLLMFVSKKYYIAQVGDSRVYLIRDGKISQITEDHSYVYELFKKGILSQKEMEYYPFKNILTRAVGSDKKVKVDVFSGKICKNDYFFLTSDGLSNEIKKEEFMEFVHYMEPEIICQNLLFYINQKDSFDDKSLVVVYIQED